MSWNEICTPKKYGGLGMKNLELWNKASIAKLVCAVALKKDMSWVRWIHDRYLQRIDWWEFKPPSDACVKKLCKVKE